MPYIVDADDDYERGGRTRRGRKERYSRWERFEASNCRVFGALFVGLVMLLLFLLLLSVTPGLEKSFMAAFWRAVVPWLLGITGTIFLVCTAIVGWSMYEFKLEHDRVKLEHDREKAQQKLLEENLSMTQRVNQMLVRADQQNDNWEVTIRGDEKSIKVVRSEVILEQARIAAAAAAEKQAARLAQQEQRKQIGGPDAGRTGGAGANGRKSAGGRLTPGAAARAWLEQGPIEIKTFAQLLDEGVVQEALQRGFLLLGYVNGVLRYGTWLALYSCAVGGVTGSGKTTTVRFLLFQAILGGAKLVMIDPAIHEPEESLAAQFRVFKGVHLLPPCDDDLEVVAHRVRFYWAEYLRRKANGDKGPPWILVIDEFNEIMALLPSDLKQELALLLLRITQSGRKYGLFCMLIGQRWSEQDLGGKPYGSQIRTSLAAMLVHRFTDEDQARKLASSRYAADCLELEAGHFFFRDTSGNMNYTVTPKTLASDGQVIQRLLEQIARAGSSPFPSVVVPKDTDEEGEIDEEIDEVVPVVESQEPGQQRAMTRITGPLSNPPVVPTQPTKKRRATLTDAVQIWNAEAAEGREIGRGRLQEKLQAAGLECTDDLAKQLLKTIKQRLEAGGAGGDQ